MTRVSDEDARKLLEHRETLSELTPGDAWIRDLAADLLDARALILDLQVWVMGHHTRSVRLGLKVIDGVAIGPERVYRCVECGARGLSRHTPECSVPRLLGEVAEHAHDSTEEDNDD